MLPLPRSGSALLLRRAGSWSLMVTVCALLAAGCGGGGGGGGPADPGDLNPSSFSFTSFGTDQVVVQAGSVSVAWTADDADDEATVSVFADLDGALETAGDRYTLVDEVVDANGERQSATVDLREVPGGAYTVIGRIRDGKGGELQVAAPGRLVVENRALLAPFGDDEGLDVAALLPRDDGSYDVLGRFRGLVDFDARNRIQSTSRNWDLFVAHFSARGVIQWLSVFESTGDMEAGQLVRAADGELLIAGSFGGTLTLPDGSTLRGQGFDVFLARVSADGEQRWVRAAASGNRDAARDLALLSDGSFVVAGPFNGGNTTVAIEFGNDRNGRRVWLDSTGIGDGFVARYASDGTPIWARGIGGDAVDTATAVTVLAGDRIVVGGSFESTARFDGGTEVRTSTGEADAFLAEWASDGTLTGVATLTGSGTDSIADLAAGPGGDLLVLANSTSDALDVAGQQSVVLASDTQNDAALCRFAADGSLRWALGEAVGAGPCSGTDLLPLADGSLLVAGTYSDGAVFGGGGPTLPSAGSVDGFVSRRDAEGSSRWVHRFGSAAAATSFELGVGADGTLWVTGDRGTADLEVITQRGSVGLPATGSGGSTEFLARFHSDGELGREPDPSRRVAGPATITRGRINIRIAGQTAFLQGFDDRETTAAFQQLLDEHPLVALLVVQRANGSDFGDRHLGACRSIARAGLETHVPFNASLYGGGLDLFLAGRRRTVADGAIVGVRSWIDDDRTTGHSIRGDREDPRHQRYLDLYTDLGIPLDYYWFSLETPRTTFLALNRSQLERYSVVTD